MGQRDENSFGQPKVWRPEPRKIQGDLPADVGVDTSVVSVGDSYDNALAESVIGLFKAEVIKFFGSWKSVGQVGWEPLQWVSWYNTERPHGTIGHRPPQEMEDDFHENMNELDKVD